MLPLLALLLTRPAFAACPAPPQSVQTELARKTEGEVRATLLQVGVGGSASNEVTTNWQASLPSQEAVDNQWYLYHLCREYEAGHLTQSQYCSISAGLWQRITGVAMPSDTCAAATASQAAAPSVTTVAVGSGATLPVPSTVAPGSTLPRNGRWTALRPGGQVVEVFGPVEIDGQPMMFMDAMGGCLTRLIPTGSTWREEVVAGRCEPWAMAVVREERNTLVIEAPDGLLRLEAADAGANSTLGSGVWSGELYNASSSFPVRLTSNGATGALSWAATGCEGSLTSRTGTTAWRVYAETTQTKGCISGATVTVRAVGPGAVLVEWVGPNGMLAAMGVLREG